MFTFFLIYSQLNALKDFPKWSGSYLRRLWVSHYCSDDIYSDKRDMSKVSHVSVPFKLVVLKDNNIFKHFKGCNTELIHRAVMPTVPRLGVTSSGNVPNSEPLAEYYSHFSKFPDILLNT